MRGRNHWRPSLRMKESAVAELRRRGSEPSHAVDDDPRNIEMFAGLGLATTYVDSGYY